MSFTARCIALLAISGLFTGSLLGAGTENRQLKSILQRFEQQTGYRFLYRESLVSRVKLELSNTAGMSELQAALQLQGLSLSLDENRKVAILTALKSEKNDGPVSVQIVDAVSGSPLPFATVTWTENAELTGQTTDDNGRFTLNPTSGAEEIRIGYVGYRTVFVQKKALLQSSSPVVSLLPDVLESSALVVSDSRYLSVPDTSAARWSNARIAGFAGEKNLFRSLEAFPAVAPVIGLNRGLVVRGSNPDAFQVLLDGMTIYHQSHLFGMLDAFQSEALQAVAFHYSLIPAQYPSPPGGTMAFFTRSGSVSKPSGSAGLSSSSVKGLVEVPFLNGKGSLLLAGRRSLIDEINWFQNEELISFGLDVNREHSSTGSTAELADNRLLLNRETGASFSDFHAKAVVDLAPGKRLQLAGYSGFDNAIESADRYFRVSDSPIFALRFRLLPVATENEWKNRSWSATYSEVAGASRFFSLQTGGSYYNSAFQKGDFAYPPQRNQPGQGGQGQQATVVDTFSNRNLVREFKINPHVDVQFNHQISVSAGAALYRYNADYEEINLQRAGVVDLARSATQLDVYGQADMHTSSGFFIQLGARVHYFSAGERLRLSPRFQMERAVPVLGVFRVGYSRNYQFLHRFSLNQQISADVWSLTGEDEPLTVSNHWFAGWKRALWSGSTLSADVYYKKTAYMRLHEISTAQFSNAVLDNPRFYENDGTSQGLEFLFDQQLGRARLALSYVWSHAEIQNDRVNSGIAYDAEWDRRHQWNLRGELPVWKGIHVFAVSTASSGAPNYLSLFSQNGQQNNPFPNESDRLGWYYRTDAGLTASFKNKRTVVDFSLSAFNVFDRNNPWYRAPVQVLERSASGPGDVRNYPVDFYDLGFRPSFDLVIKF